MDIKEIARLQDFCDYVLEVYNSMPEGPAKDRLSNIRKEVGNLKIKNIIETQVFFINTIFNVKDKTDNMPTNSSVSVDIDEKSYPVINITNNYNDINNKNNVDDEIEKCIKMANVINYYVSSQKEYLK